MTVHKSFNNLPDDHAELHAAFFPLSRRDPPPVASASRHDRDLGIKNAIRVCAVGKKNYLFVGHPDAGWRSAVLYSILGTCKLHGINEWSYLTWALPRLAAATNHTAHEFTPQRFAQLAR